MIRHNYKRRAQEAVENGEQPPYPLGAYCLFSSIRRKTLSAQKPNLTQKQIFKAISKEWRRLPEKGAYKAIAAEDYKEYKRLSKGVASQGDGACSRWRKETGNSTLRGKKTSQKADRQPSYVIRAGGFQMSPVKISTRQTDLPAQVPAALTTEMLQSDGMPFLPSRASFVQEQEIKSECDPDAHASSKYHEDSSRNQFINSALSSTGKMTQVIAPELRQPNEDSWDSSRSICTSSDEVEGWTPTEYARPLQCMENHAKVDRNEGAKAPPFDFSSTSTETPMLAKRPQLIIRINLD